MKKVLAVFLTVVLLCGMGLGGRWWLCRSPRGVFNTAGAAETMEQLLSEKSREDWRRQLSPLWKGSVTEFEDRDEVFNALFDAATAEGQFGYLEKTGESSLTEAVYGLYCGDYALADLTLRWEDGQWKWVGTALSDGALPCETLTLSVIVPSDCTPIVNARPLGESYRAEKLDYDDLTELEKRFDTVPALQRYEVSGLYRNPAVEAEGQVLMYSDGTEFRFCPPDAHSYDFRILVPDDASVLVNGALLSAEESSARESLWVPVDVPEELQPLLPASLLYEFSGLYSRPEITVTAADGTILEGAERSDGIRVYARSFDAAPEEELSAMVENYMNAACRFGASLAYTDTMNLYVDWNSELGQFYQMAQPSLGWILGTGLEIHKIWSDSYIPLGNDACVCSVHCQCATTNYYRTDELDLCCRLLCVRTPNGWRVQDMAYD